MDAQTRAFGPNMAVLASGTVSLEPIRAQFLINIGGSAIWS